MKVFSMLVLVFALLACEGPAGPQGPTGESGGAASIEYPELNMKTRQESEVVIGPGLIVRDIKWRLIDYDFADALASEQPRRIILSYGYQFKVANNSETAATSNIRLSFLDADGFVIFSRALGNQRVAPGEIYSVSLSTLTELTSINSANAIARLTIDII